MKKILVVSEKYWPFGGAELAIHCIIRMLRNEGFHITVLTGTRKVERLERVEYLYSSLLAVPTKIHLWKNLTVAGQCIEKFIKDSDLVYIPRLAYPLIPLAKKRKKKIIVHLFDFQPVNYEATISYPFEGYKNSLLYKMKQTLLEERSEYEGLLRSVASCLFTPTNSLVRLWLRQANVIICEAERHKEIIVHIMPELLDKMKVVYDPLPDVPFVNKEVDRQRFLYLGGGALGKGIRTLVEASIKLLSRNCNNNPILFVFAKIMKKKQKLLFERLNKTFNNAFIILSRLSRDKVLEWHSKCTSLIVPTLWEEPLPSVMLESMLAGTIPIASRAGGVPEIVQGTYAEKMLFTPSDVDALVERMESVLSLSNEQLANIGMRLREDILKKFDKKVIRSQLLKAFS